MKTILTLLAWFAAAGILVADVDIGQRARECAAATGHTYKECLNALKVGRWCKENPQGGVYYGQTYDARATAALLAECTRLLTEPVPAAAVENDQDLRQRQMAQQYAVATGRSYEECLKAVWTYEWCMAHPQGSVVGGVTFDAAATTRELAAAMRVLQVKPAVAAAPAAGGVFGRVLESSIDGEFEGFESDKVFKLLNGQVWQQMDFYYHYHYAYGPRVLIYQGNGGTMMKVEGVERAVRVMQLR